MSQEHVEMSTGQEVAEAVALSKGVFGILPEESYFPEGHVLVPTDIDDPILREKVDDAIRYELERVIDSFRPEEKLFVIQRLGLAHAIHNTCSLIERGLDVYLAQVPPADGKISGDDGWYNFKRNAEMWIYNKDRKGMFDRFFPTVEQLKNLSISQIVFCEEVKPELSSQLQALIDTPPADFKSSPHIHRQLRDYKRLGCKVSAFGVDARKRDDWE
jgi:hypothetical protein